MINLKDFLPSLNIKDRKIFVENFDLEILKKETPIFVYSKEAIDYFINKVKNAFKDYDTKIFYAVKANSNINILKIYKENDIGFDTVSKGELFRVLKVEKDLENTIFSGVGKREDEIEYALKNNILAINVESFSELKTTLKVAQKLNKIANISIRVNPEVNPKTHPYIATALKKSKFGVSFKDALLMYKLAKKEKYLNPIGIHFHIGSQIFEKKPFLEALDKTLEFIKVLKKENIVLDFIDIGGGWGVKYSPNDPLFPLEDFAKKVINKLKNFEYKLKLFVEPGRYLIANTAIMLTKILYIKKNEDKTFYICDAGMNDFPRPSLYQAYHHIEPLYQNKEDIEIVDIVGPICESGDFLAKDREIKKCQEGDLLVCFSAGAYTMSMANNYNSRPRAKEILVKKDKHIVIRKRETLEDLICREILGD